MRLHRLSAISGFRGFGPRAPGPGLIEAGYRRIRSFASRDGGGSPGLRAPASSKPCRDCAANRPGAGSPELRDPPSSRLVLGLGALVSVS